jgi:hypothetical protein
MPSAVSRSYGEKGVAVSRLGFSKGEIGSLRSVTFYNLNRGECYVDKWMWSREYFPAKCQSK